MFVNNHTCALVLFRNNCPCECRNNCQMFAIGLVFYLKKNRMARRHAPFSWRHAPFSERHAPFDKKNMAQCIADVPFFISSNDPLGRRATTLANYQILMPLWKLKKMPTEGKEKGRRCGGRQKQPHAET